MEYAATITVNPLTALCMLENFVELTSGIWLQWWITSVLLIIVVWYCLIVHTSFEFYLGDAIVQNGVTSIVGQCIIQLAKIKGVSSINIIRDRSEKYFCSFFFLPDYSIRLVSLVINLQLESFMTCFLFLAQKSVSIANVWSGASPYKSWTIFFFEPV